MSVKYYVMAAAQSESRSERRCFKRLLSKCSGVETIVTYEWVMGSFPPHTLLTHIHPTHPHTLTSLPLLVDTIVTARAWGHTTSIQKTILNERKY